MESDGSALGEDMEPEGGPLYIFAGGYLRTDPTRNMVLLSMDQGWYLLAQQDRGGDEDCVGPD